MLPLTQRLAFALFALVTLTLGARGFYRLFLRIVRGRRDPDQRTDLPVRRLWHALRTTLLQERVFKKRRILSTFHAFIFYAFVLYLLVNAVDAVEGYTTLNLFATGPAHAVYGFLADLFSVLAIVGVFAFVLRRFALPQRSDFRFNPRTLLHPDVRSGYLQRDSLIVSAFIVLHLASRIVGNAARVAQTGPDSAEPVSSFLARLIEPAHAEACRIFGYWGALGSVLLFLAYFPYSKHIHILLAPVKYFFRRTQSSGELPALKLDALLSPEPDQPAPELGAETLADFGWPRLLDAYACIQCNRCQDVCPATRTGKSLSPSALEINKRMALNTIAGEVSPFALTGQAAFEQGASPGSPLLGAILSEEALWACTTCGACLEVCPTADEPMLDLIDLRRHQVMLAGEFPAQLQTAFRGMERAKNPWGLAREKRMAWAEGLNVPTTEQDPDPDVLYWVGCAASYDPAAQKTARAVVQLLAAAGVRYAVLGNRECCTGDSARRAGNEMLYQELATANIATLDTVKPKRILASCPHCLNAIGTEYKQLGGHYQAMHHTEFFDELLREGRLKPHALHTTITFHDPCYLGRHRGTYDQPRSILHILSNDVVELPRNQSNAFCCGAGGAQFWKEEEPGDERIADNRMREAVSTLSQASGDRVLAVGCPFCKSMLQSSTPASTSPVAIKDIAELLLESIQTATPALTPPAQPPKDRHSERSAAEPKELHPVPSHESDAPRLASETREGKTFEAQDPQATTVIPSEDKSLPDGTAAESAKPERRKWAPKKNTDLTPADPVAPTAQPSANATGLTPSLNESDSPSPTRKKWKPGAPGS